MAGVTTIVNASVKAAAAASTVGLGLGGAALINQSLQLSKYAKVASGNFEPTGGNMMFPQDIRTKGTPFIQLQFMQYQRRSINSQIALQITSEPIILPIPNNLSDTLAEEWSVQDLGPAIGAGLDAAGSSTGGGLEAAVGTARGFFSGAAAQIANNLASKVAGVSTAASVIAGQSINPFQAQVYNKPTFKTHGFNWKLMPSTYDESIVIRNIAMALQYHMSPGLSPGGSNVLFSYPDILHIVFSPNDFLYQFKPVVVKNVKVNYAPSGPSFIQTPRSERAPTAVEISIETEEMEFWSKRDWESGPYSSLGIR